MIFGLLFLCLQAFLVFIKPRYFLVCYLLFISSFLGYIPNDFLINGNEIGLYFHSLLLVSNYAIYYKRLNRHPKYIKIVLNFLILLYFYGLISPILLGYSTILQSTIESKEFSTLFLVHYLFVHSRQFSFSYVYNIISLLGCYLLFVLLVFVMFGFIPPEYVKVSGQIEYNYPALLSLYLFLNASLANSNRKKFISTVLIMIWTVGMIYEGHAAIMLTTTIGCLIILYRIPLTFFIKNYIRLIVGILCLVVIFYVLPTGQIIEYLSDTGSFRARGIYIIERWELIIDRPLLGYGFMHKSAITLGDIIYTESLSFIDSGYIDLLGKFGFLGTAIYLVAISLIFFKKTNSIISLSLKLFFLQYLVVNVTWSVLSFSIGTIALSFAIYMITIKKCEDEYTRV